MDQKPCPHGRNGDGTPMGDGMGPTETTIAYWAQHDSTAAGLDYQHPRRVGRSGADTPTCTATQTCGSGHRRVWVNGGPKVAPLPKSRDLEERALGVRHGRVYRA